VEAVVNDIRPRVLLAGTAEAIEKFQALLGAEVEIIPARSVREALACADGDIDLILCNVRFDDSRMFDFLQALNKRPAARRAPVICCRVLLHTLPGVHHAVEMALEALGVAAFVDLAKLAQRDGAAAAEEKLREIVMAHLSRVTGA
jgi:hypothetical protein